MHHAKNGWVLKNKASGIEVFGGVTNDTVTLQQATTKYSARQV
jgi:hypothetical protein